MTQNAIEIRDLVKTYSSDLLKRTVRALLGISFDVKDGEIFGFVGHNGAGKTTTIKVVCGLQYPTSGGAKIYGVDFRDPKARLPMGYLPEQPYFYEYLTPLEALAFYGGLSNMPKKLIEKRSEEVLASVKLEFAADRRIRTFSKGMQQRFGMAQALLHDPKLLVLDEPMSGLDPIGRKMMRDIILEQKKKGKTVFFSSHVLSDVEEISDKVGIIIQGKMRAVGEIHELLGKPERFEFGLKRVETEKKAELEKFGEVYDKGEFVYLTVTGEKKRDDANAFIKNAGIELESYNAKRKSLEDLFVEAMNTD